MTTSTKGRMAIVILSVLALVATACSSDDDAAPAAGAVATTAAPAATEAPEATTATEAPEATTAPEAAALDPIKFAVINMEDGLYAFPESSGAVQILADHYNAQGGIGGHLIELEVCTAGDDPESAQACALRFANDDAVQFVFLAAVLNSAPVFEVLGPDGADKPLLGHLLWDVPDSLQPGLYSMDPGLLPMAYEVIRYAVEVDGVTNLAVLVDDSDIGEATLAVVDFFLAGLGGATMTPVSISPGQADYLPAMAAAGVDKADGLALLIAESAACQTTRDALEALGQGDVRAYVGDWCTGEDFRVNGTAEGWRIVVGQNGVLTDDPEAQELRDIYAAAGADAPYGVAFATATNMDFARQVLELAVESAGGVPSTADIHAAAVAWDGHDLFLGPDTASCPGQGAWVSTCNSAARVITLENGAWVPLADFNVIDVAIFDPLLG
jgi:branched-chain amino acid transport system substrate-binding protein